MASTAAGDINRSNSCKPSANYVQWGYVDATSASNCQDSWHHQHQQQFWSKTVFLSKYAKPTKPNVCFWCSHNQLFFFVFNFYLFLTHHKLCKTDYHNMVLNADCQIQYVYGNGYSSILILLHRLDFTMLFDHVQVHHTTMQLTSEVRSSKQCRNSTITVSSVPVDDQMSQLIHKLNYTW